MVAYAYAAQFPRATERVVLMDAFLPGIGNWKDVWLLRDLWHFHFYGEVPLALVQGRERIYFEHFWNRSEEHTSELQSLAYLVCRLLLEKKKQTVGPIRHRIRAAV